MPRAEARKEIARRAGAPHGQRPHRQGLRGEAAHQEKTLPVPEVGSPLQRAGIEELARRDVLGRDAFLARRQEQNRPFGDHDERRETQPGPCSRGTRHPPANAPHDHPHLR